MRWPWSKRRDPEAAARLRAEAEERLAAGDVEGARERLEAALAADAEDAAALLALAEVLLCDLDRPEAALELLTRGRAALGALDQERALDALWVEATACAQLDDVARALELHEAALGLSPGDAWHLSGKGQRLFDLARFDEARDVLARARAAFALAGDEDAATHYYEGCLLERDDRVGDADVRFARAEELDPDAFPRPIRLSKKAYDRVVEEALASLPDEFQRHLKNVIVQTVDVPPADMLRQTGHDPLLLGLYEGVSVAGEYEDHGPARQPPRVSLYKRNIEKSGATRDEVVEQVRITVLHEVGHHLGYDDEGLDEIGLG